MPRTPQQERAVRSFVRNYTLLLTWLQATNLPLLTITLFYADRHGWRVLFQDYGHLLITWSLAAIVFYIVSRSRTRTITENLLREFEAPQPEEPGAAATPCIPEAFTATK
jgi:hypothetical protein